MHQEAKGVNVFDGDCSLGRDVGAVMNHLHAHLLQALLHGGLFGFFPIVFLVWKGVDFGAEIGGFRHDFTHAASALPLNDDRV